MKLILRFEQPDGMGIYQGTSYIPYDAARHPLPESDYGLRKWREMYSRSARERFFFGFNSVKQARAWFYDRNVLNIMEEHGCKLVAYAVEDEHIHVGYAQTVFMIEHAVLVAELDPTDLHHPRFDETYQTLYNAVVEAL